MLHQSIDLTHASVYLTEQLSPTAAALASRCGQLTVSEFLGREIPAGNVDVRGVRHEDLTQLSFPDGRFDAVVALDVLEHIANYGQALSEMYRVLRKGGRLIVTAPFAINSDVHIVRAAIASNGKVEHILTPEFHGDPLNSSGVLCFYHFGWDLLSDLRSAGFNKAQLLLAWSAAYAYVGPEQSVFIAVR